MINKYRQLDDFAREFGWPKYRLEQIRHAIFSQRIGAYAQMRALPLELRAALRESLGETVCRITPLASEAREQVEKRLFQLHDGKRIETVALRFQKGWSSFCISSQCGCGFGCAFCATGGMGFARNLSAEEISDQLLYFFLAGQKLDSVSFMGMGEPLANPHVFEALRDMTDTALFGLGQRRITISTIGIVPGIRCLTKAFPQVNIAYSLHSPFDRQRTEIMPVNRKYPMAQVLDALDAHIRATDRKVFLAYILLDGVNDTEAHARALAALVQRRGECARLYHVDLIPYNPHGAQDRFAPSGKRRLQGFQRELLAAGVRASVRAQFGSGIRAACGQLCVEAEQ